jgi:uncharacterized protein YecT (DUF1311 family)
MRRRAACVLGLAAISTCLPGIGVGETLDPAPYQQALQQADTDLNQTYQQVIAALDPVARASLKSTQRSWIVFKEADFAVFARMAHPAGEDAGLYAYESTEENNQAASLRSLGKPLNMDSEDFDGQAVTTSQQADQLLNTIYRQLMGLMPPELTGPEKSAQASWIRFRDFYCQLDASLKGGASDDSVLRTVTLRRATQLAWYVRIAVEMKLPVPDSASTSTDAAEEKPTDPPAADPFRFAK